MAGKLPLWRILVEAVGLPWARRAAFAKALALPAAALILLELGWWLGSGEEQSRLVAWAAWAANVIVWVLFAVIVHRLVLLDLQPGDVPLVPGWGRRETYFLGWLALASAALWAYSMAAAAVFTIRGGSFLLPFAVSVGSFAGVFGVAYLIARLAPVLPATAIDAQAGLAGAWRQTRGNGWRMVLIVGVLPLAFRFISTFLAGDEPGIAHGVLVTVLATLLLTIEISALSLAYRELAAET